MERLTRIEAAASSGTQVELIAGDFLPLGSGSMKVIEAAAGQGDGKLIEFEYVAYTGVPMKLDPFVYPVIADFAGCSFRSQELPVRVLHQANHGVGHTITAALVGAQIEGRARVSRDTEDAREFVASLKNNFPWQVSMGAVVQAAEFLKPGATALVNGQNVSGPMHIARKWTVDEISVCDLGADRRTSARLAARSQTGGTGMKTFEEWLKELGLEAASDEQKNRLRTAYDAEVKAIKAAANNAGGQPPAGGSGDGAGTPGSGEGFARIDAVVAEEKRKNGIEELGVKYARENPGRVEDIKAIAAKATADKWTLAQTELELLRTGRAPAPAVRGTSGRDRRSASHLEAAALMSVGISGDELIKSKAASEQVVDEADREFRGGIRLKELIRIAASANGYQGRQEVTPANWRELVTWASPETHQIQAAGGLSTLSLPGILGSVANKALGKVAADPVWVAPKIAGRASHPNFHTHTIYSLALSGELEEVGPTGELKDLSIGEESYTRQVGTRGAVLRLSRTDIINDDLGAFARNANGLARKAYSTREKAMFKVVNVTGAGSTHFTAARGNYLTGTAFGIAGVGLAIAAFRGLTGPDGDPIMVEPALMLVTPTNEEASRQTLMSGGSLIVTGLASTSAKSLGASPNIYAGRFGGKPEVSPWLENVDLTGYSTTAWYLLADPDNYPCFEIAYLDGNETPIVDYFGIEAQADVLGMTWRVYWDFGVGASEWRAGVKSAGA